MLDNINIYHDKNILEETFIDLNQIQLFCLLSLIITLFREHLEQCWIFMNYTLHIYFKLEIKITKSILQQRIHETIIVIAHIIKKNISHCNNLQYFNKQHSVLVRTADQMTAIVVAPCAENTAVTRERSADRHRKSASFLFTSFTVTNAMTPNPIRRRHWRRSRTFSRRLLIVHWRDEWVLREPCFNRSQWSNWWKDPPSRANKQFRKLMYVTVGCALVMCSL